MKRRIIHRLLTPANFISSCGKAHAYIDQNKRAGPSHSSAPSTTQAGSIQGRAASGTTNCGGGGRSVSPFFESAIKGALTVHS